MHQLLRAWTAWPAWTTSAPTTMWSTGLTVSAQLAAAACAWANCSNAYATFSPLRSLVALLLDVVPTGKWLPCHFCLTCTEYLLQTQWKKYTDGLAKATCKAEQRRLLDKGPPINISVSALVHVSEFHLPLSRDT